MRTRAARDNDSESPLVTIDEAAGLLKIGRVMVHRLIRLGELKSIRIGRCRRVLHESVRELIAKGGTL